MESSNVEGRLGTAETGGTEHAHKDLGVMYRPRARDRPSSAAKASGVRDSRSDADAASAAPWCTEAVKSGGSGFYSFQQCMACTLLVQKNHRSGNFDAGYLSASGVPNSLSR